MIHIIDQMKVIFKGTIVNWDCHGGSLEITLTVPLIYNFRLDESLYLYITILSNPWLQSGAMILFLNKKDIFQDKIRLFPLKVSLYR